MNQKTIEQSTDWFLSTEDKNGETRLIPCSEHTDLFEMIKKEPDDSLDKLADAMLEASKPKWKYHYFKSYFLKIDEIKKLVKYGEKYKTYTVFLVRNYYRTKYEQNWFFPVINVIICGTVVGTYLQKNDFCCEIQDETGSILCVDEGYVEEKLSNMNEAYLKLHEEFQNLEANYKTEQLIITKNKYRQWIQPSDNSVNVLTEKSKLSVAAAMRLLARKKKELIQENNQLQLKHNEVKGKKVVIFGRVLENEQKYISIKKSIIASEKEETWFQENLKLSKNAKETFEIYN